MLDTNEEKIRLIQIVRKYPCLWKPQWAEFNMPEVKAQTWIKVAEEMSSQPYACRKRWNAIREGVMRTLKRDSEGNCKFTYYLAKHLDFIEPYLTIVKGRYKNFPNEQNTSKEQCDTMEDMQCNNNTNSSTLSALSDQLAKEPINEERRPSKVLESANEDANLLNIPASSKVLEYAKEDTNLINRPESKSKKAMNNNDVSNTLHIEWVKKKKDADGNQSFLNSLRPYLRDMTAKQNRRFQQKVITLIDEILDDADIPQVIFCSLPIETITESSEYQ